VAETVAGLRVWAAATNPAEAAQARQ